MSAREAWCFIFEFRSQFPPSKHSRKMPRLLRAFVVLLLSSLLLQTCVLESQALTARQWAAIPIGKSPWRRLQQVAIHTNATIAASTSRSTVHRRLDDKNSLVQKLNDLEAFFNKLNGMTIEQILPETEARNLDFGALNVGMQVVHDSGQSKSVDAALDKASDAVKVVIQNLENLNKALIIVRAQQEVIQYLNNVFYQWTANSNNRATNYAEFAKNCKSIESTGANTLRYLSRAEVPDESPKEFPLAIARGMLVVVAIKQSCAGANKRTDVNARSDFDYVATFLEQAKVEGAEALRAKLKAADGESTGNSYSNGKMQDTINGAFDSNDDFFDAINNVTDSDAWRAAMGEDQDAADLAKLQAMAIAKSHQVITKSLTKLDDKVQVTHDERMVKIGSINVNIDGWHTKKMEKIGTMKSVFTGQHNERMDKLGKIDSAVTTVNNKARQGFQGVQDKLYGIQDQLVGKIAQVGDLVTQDKEQTIAYLSDELRKSAQVTYAHISKIDNQVTRGGEEIMNSLERTKSLAEQQYAATGNTLVSASEATGQLISEAFEVMKVTAVNGFNQVLDIVSTKIADTANAISADLAVVDRQLDFVNNRLVVVENAAASLENKLEMTNIMLQNLDASVDGVMNELGKFSNTVKQILMENDVTDLHRRYSGIRSAYQLYMENDASSSTQKRLEDACTGQKAYDLFLSYLHLIDIEDSRLPRQMDAFGHNVNNYKRFGMTVIGALRNLSMLSNICTGIAFQGMTQEDLELKVREHNELIRHAAGQFTRHVEEVLPVYMIRYYVKKELQAWSTQQWGGDVATQKERAETLREELQASVGDFAQITVFYAGGTDGTNQIQLLHLDEQGSNATDIASIRRRGAMVSDNKRLAVMWSATKQLPADEHNKMDNTLLLKQGIYRGSVSTKNNAAGCVVAQDPTYYPRCYANCTCQHYEDFASATDANAGRALSVFNSTAFESDFTIASTTDPYVDYFMEDILVEVEGLGTVAYGELRAPTLSKERVQKDRILWEGYTNTGKFNAAVSSVKGTLLHNNEMTLSLDYSATTTGSFRQTLQLFCSGRRQEKVFRIPSIKISYTCHEVVRSSLPEDSEAFVMSGVPTARLKNAVCTQGDGGKLCRVVGDFESITDDPTALEIGSNIQDLTLYEKPGWKGSFVICKGCTVGELFLGGITFGSLALKTPQASLLPYLDLKCEKILDVLMVCTETSV